MKFYTRGKSASGLICVAIALLCSSAAVAKETNPLASVLRSPSDAQSAVGHISANRNFIKLVYSQSGTRGAEICGDSEQDGAETCDDGNTTPGDGCDATCQVEAGSDCTAAVDGITGSNILPNGGFEDGPVDWIEDQEFGITFGPISSPLNCGGCNFASEAEGEWWMWNGGWSEALATSVNQDVVIPTDATTLQLNIWEAFCVPQDGSGDNVTVMIDGTEVFNTGTCNDEVPGDYAEETIDLTGAAAIAACGGTGCNDGLSHNIKVRGAMDFNPGDPQTGSIFVDEVRLNVVLAEPIPPIPSSCYVGVCGDSVVSDGESCDDGNLADGDGCSSACAIEEDTHVCINDLADSGFGVAGGALGIADDITDGSLEQGGPNPNWAETGTQFFPICSEATCGASLADDGDFFGWFGGSVDPNAQSITQDVMIGNDAAALEFELLIGVCDKDGGGTEVGADYLRVSIDGTTVWDRPCTSDNATYETQSIDLATADGGPYNDGQMHTVVISGETFALGTDPGFSNHFVDDIRIEYAVSPDRSAVGSDCFELDGLCAATSFGIEKFEAGLGIMSTFELGTLNATWTDTSDEWTADDGSDPSGCGTSDLSVANWSGGNFTGGTGEAACADADGAAEALTGDPLAACINAPDPTAECQMRTYLCTPAMDVSAMTDPGVTATVWYQTATQDFETPDFDDDEIFQVLVGEQAPNAFTIANYRSDGVVLDHNSTTLNSSAPLTIGTNLDDFRNPAVQPCVDPLEDLPCTISGQEDPLDETSLYVCYHYAGIFSWFAEVDNVAMRADNCTSGDADFDLVSDDTDNCTLLDNPDQTDSNGDGIGNRCDADIAGNFGDPVGSNNCNVDFFDLGRFKEVFLTADPDADFVGAGGVGAPNGFVDFFDLGVLKELFLAPPGPSANACVPTP